MTSCKVVSKFYAHFANGTETTCCDSDKPSVFPCEKETKELLLSNDKEVAIDEDNVHQPSSSSNLNFTLLHDVEQHEKGWTNKNCVK